MSRVSALLLSSLAVVCAGQAAAQGFPNKPVRVIVSTAGGSGDRSVRLIAPSVSAGLGQQVIVENRSTSVVGDIVAKAPADGYTLLMDATSLWIGPLLQDMPYDVIRDFAPVSTTDRAPSMLGVHPSLPVNSMKEFVAYAKSRPGQLNYGTSQPGTLSHLASEMFRTSTGVDMVQVPFKGGGAAVAATLAGQVHMIFNSAGSLMQHVRSGKIKTLGIASLQPSLLAPGIPTLASQGLAGFEATLVQGLLAPAKTPPAAVRRLNQEIVNALNSPDVREKYLAVGFEPSPSTPEEFAAMIKSERTKWAKLIKDVGIKAN